MEMMVHRLGTEEIDLVALAAWAGGRNLLARDRMAGPEDHILIFVFGTLNLKFEYATLE